MAGQVDSPVLDRIPVIATFRAAAAGRHPHRIIGGLLRLHA
ncbi:hypothetical protein [Labrys monachus]|uniref:Uncharacterized protein n=1 Tax=Labrys monachus TaxID=217067 RepID=A0ABU0FLN0_9HYPH|nr:hypothetical protein [Labrys monachus]MDQ0395386.1 hypothetical protein [Labrys monachus]